MSAGIIFRASGVAKGNKPWLELTASPGSDAEKMLFAIHHRYVGRGPYRR